MAVASEMRSARPRPEGIIGADINRPNSGGESVILSRNAPVVDIRNIIGKRVGEPGIR